MYLTRQVAVYLGTHCKAQRECFPGVLNGWHNCLFIYWRTNCIV